MSSPEPDDEALDDDALAAQYVIGTLSLDERYIVEARLPNDEPLAARLRFFERAFQPLAATVPDAVPSTLCDRRIANAIRARAGDAEAPGRHETGQREQASTSAITDSGLGRSRARWRLVALAASLAAVALGAALSSALTGIGPLGRTRVADVTIAPAEPDTAAEVERTALSLLRDSEGRARYLVEIGDDDSVSITALDRADAADAGSLQLWMADTESGALRSVGLLPRDDWSSVRVPESPLTDAPAFAVSIEPPGGSPGEGPTGDVVFEGSIHPVRDGFQ